MFLKPRTVPGTHAGSVNICSESKWPRCLCPEPLLRYCILTDFSSFPWASHERALSLGMCPLHSYPFSKVSQSPGASEPEIFPTITSSVSKASFWRCQPSVSLSLRERPTQAKAWPQTRSPPPTQPENTVTQPSLAGLAHQSCSQGYKPISLAFPSPSPWRSLEEPSIALIPAWRR